MAEKELVYTHNGWCPICESGVQFRAKYHWYRDHLLCSGCGSIPRERAIAYVITRESPDWRNKSIHESSPGNRGISVKLNDQCANYIATQYYPDKELGETYEGFQNENLEKQTFSDEQFDLVVTLDVMEHVNHPDKVFQEVHRTLKTGGRYIFTVPTYKGKIESERRAFYRDDGSIEHLAEPEYHGNPVSDAGSLVTFHYGYDLAEMIYKWSGFHVKVSRFHDHRLGVIGDFTEVYVLSK